jgi:hypothetical protein
MMNDDLARALDPVRLAMHAGVTPDPWQADVMRGDRMPLLMNCSRQSGKSLTAALVALHTALYTPDSLVLLLSPSLRQSQELFRTCLRCYRELGRPVPADAETALRLELTTGSRIISLPGTETSIRGFAAVRLLVVDEAARVADALYFAVRPMLAVSGGRLIALSTPFGKRGWWHHAWAEEGHDWRRIEVPATMCPRIRPDFLAAERRALGDWWYRQEYECAFSETTDQLFGYDLVQAAVSEDVLPLFAAHPVPDVVPEAEDVRPLWGIG